MAFNEARVSQWDTRPGDDAAIERAAEELNNVAGNGWTNARCCGGTRRWRGQSAKESQS